MPATYVGRYILRTHPRLVCTCTVQYIGNFMSPLLPFCPYVAGSRAQESQAVLQSELVLQGNLQPNLYINTQLLRTKPLKIYSSTRGIIPAMSYQGTPKTRTVCLWLAYFSATSFSTASPWRMAQLSYVVSGNNEDTRDSWSMYTKI